MKERIGGLSTPSDKAELMGFPLFQIISAQNISNMVRKTTSQFIAEAKAVHGDKYDYSKVEYVYATTKVCIVCPEHGEFWQTPSKHLLGQGCPLCGTIKRADKKRLSTNDFIYRARMVHKDKYDYSKSVYKGTLVKLCITCPIHGEFWQSPEPHLRGEGCPTCARIASKHEIYNVGINDYQGKIKQGNKHIQSYLTWQHMLSRCYCSSRKEKYPTYKDCSVCHEWQYFSKFKKWFDEHYVEGWHLDKDILVKGNKVYGPDTCCFVPPEINCMFTKCDKRRGPYPLGVSFINAKNKFYASIKRDKKTRTIGYYDDPEEAFYAYKEAKEARIKELADKWKDKLDPRVYEAMYNYKVEITD